MPLAGWTHLAITHSGSHLSIFTNATQAMDMELPSQLSGSQPGGYSIQLGNQLGGMYAANMDVACLGLYREVLTQEEIQAAMYKCDNSKLVNVYVLFANLTPNIL